MADDSAPAAAATKPRRSGDKAKKAEAGPGKEGLIMEKAESRDIEEAREGSVLTVISKRLRAANKKIKRCEEIEQARAEGKEINDQQVGRAAAQTAGWLGMGQSVWEVPALQLSACLGLQGARWPLRSLWLTDGAAVCRDAHCALQSLPAALEGKGRSG